MTTALEIIEQAFRETNLIPVGKSPTTDQRAEALTRLNVLVSSVLGFEVGEKLQDWYIGLEGIAIQDRPWGWDQIVWQFPPINSRLLCSVQSAQLVYMPVNPSPGSRISVVPTLTDFSAFNLTLDGNGALVDGAATFVCDAADTVYDFKYDDTNANWVPVAPITAEDDELPYPLEYDDAFITALAMRLNPRYGRAVSDDTRATMERGFEQLRARYRQITPTPADPAVLAMSVQVYNRQYYPWGGRGRNGWMG